MDKSWMDAPRHTEEYLQGLARFLGYAFTKSSVENKILCPCKNCVNSYWREERIVREHLVCEGFVEGYKQWMFHGERASSSANPPNFYDAEDRDESDDISDLLRDLAGGLDDTGDFEDDGSTDQDNSVLESLHKLEADSRQELYPGCKNFSKLRFLVRLLHTKLLGGWSDKSFNLLLYLLKDAYPESAIPKNYNEAKKLVKCLGLGYVNIHACENDCILFWKANANANSCPKCKASRWKSERKYADGKRVHKAPKKVLRYFPIKKRLQRLFACSRTAALTRWHAEQRTEEDGVLRHPADSLLWKDFDEKNQDEITPELLDDGSKEKGGRTITKKANIYARLNKPKIQIPLNEHGQPIGPDATEFANFIGTLVRKHISPKELDWRDVDEEKKLLVWDHLQAFYDVDSTALRYVVNTSHTKWKEWKADLKKTRFDPALTDEELMKKRDERISEADWKDLIKYWRSPEFEACSARAKENRAKSTVPHTAGSKSHARVTQEMAEELGYAPRRDEVYIRTHTLKKGPQKGQHVPQAAPIINDLLEAAKEHPDWKEKSIKEGDLYARVCGMKEPRGRVRVLGLGPTPQDVGTPGTRGKMNTRLLVEMVARRQAEHRMSTMEEHMQQLQEQVNQMKEMMLTSQGGHNLETPSSQHGSNSRQNSRVELEEDNDGEEDDDEGIHIQRRVVANPFPKGSSTHQDESLIGTDVLLYAWTGRESPVAKATILSIDPDTVVGDEPLGPATYEVLVNVAIKRDATLPYQYDDL